MAKILYHVTPSANVESILKNGLLRCHGDHKSAFIFLSEDPDSWIDDELVLLDVDVDGLKCRFTTPCIENTDEICVWGDIPPERIKLHEKTKVLFLDIDGVLNCMYPTPSDDHEWIDLEEWRYGFNPELVARLRFVIANTNCKIVVSSSWRHHTNYAPYQHDRNWRDVLAEKLRRPREEVFAGETDYDEKGRRGVEILQWLSDHPTDVYCVVDDEIVDIEPYIDKDKIVKTDMRYGLSLADAKRIIEKLNEGDKTNEI